MWSLSLAKEGEHEQIDLALLLALIVLLVAVLLVAARAGETTLSVHTQHRAVLRDGR